MADIHYNLALIKSKVSHEQFMQISMLIPLPLTTVEIVNLTAQGIDVDSACIHDHMSDPSSGNKATILLGALVR